MSAEIVNKAGCERLLDEYLLQKVQYTKDRTSWEERNRKYKEYLDKKGQWERKEGPYLRHQNVDHNNSFIVDGWSNWDGDNACRECAGGKPSWAGDGKWEQCDNDKKVTKKRFHHDNNYPSQVANAWDHHHGRLPYWNKYIQSGGKHANGKAADTRYWDCDLPEHIKGDWKNLYQSEKPQEIPHPGSEPAQPNIPDVVCCSIDFADIASDKININDVNQNCSLQTNDQPTKTDGPTTFSKKTPTDNNDNQTQTILITVTIIFLLCCCSSSSISSILFMKKR